MNIALEETSEWVDGVEKNRFGDAFIRGNNVLVSRRPSCEKLTDWRPLLNTQECVAPHPPVHHCSLRVDIIKYSRSTQCSNTIVFWVSLYSRIYW